ncbi:cip1-interacting zinc finger protein [Suncus etruscus]|uniref:cip1-interacting zinc finger protein n=1 Tax=Suncus etruscus TaxID=109475 RepID=UPI00210F2ED4|nr:cip1-interacting zinc finger protein [Suncus etruscus]
MFSQQQNPQQQQLQQLQQLQQQQLQQLQQQQLQQQQLLQLQQLLQQSPPPAPLPVTMGQRLPPPPPQQQLLNLSSSASSLQRALFLQQLQGLDQFAVPPAMYDSAGLAMPMTTLGSNFRSYNLAAPNIPTPSLTSPQLAAPNLQQIFPQATRQSLLGPPPAGVPINPPQQRHLSRNHHKQTRPFPTRKDFSSQTVPLEDPLEGSEDGEPQAETLDQDSSSEPDSIAQEKDAPASQPESLEEDCEPPVKRTKSSKESSEKGHPGQLQAKVQPQARMMAPKQTQTSEVTLDTPEARVLPRFQFRALQVQAQVQPQSQSRVSPADVQAPERPRKPVQTQTSELAPVPEQVQIRDAQPAEQQPQEQTQVPMAEGAPAPGHSEGLHRPSGTIGAAEGPSEPVGPQLSTEESPQELPSSLDVREFERKSRDMLGTWGAGASLKVTIQQSNSSRAFSTLPVTPAPRPNDVASADPPALPSKQGLQFCCCICKANCGSQQEFQEHLASTEHQQRLGEIQHTNQTCLLSLLPMPRDVLDKEREEPPSQRWCHTCQANYTGDLIQHRRTKEHKTAKQSLRPFCMVCDRSFKTPRKFVEHVKSQGHKDKAKELKVLEIAGQDDDQFITVDAVGCFEGDEEEEEEEEEEEGDIEVEDEVCKQMKAKDESTEKQKEPETYSPNTAYGVDFLVPATGHVCRACRKFYPGGEGTKLSHCKSLAHFENLQKNKKAKKPSPIPRPVSRRCAINARNALSALFTHGGRSPNQHSTQDMAKAPSRGAQSTAPPPRRSSRLRT